MLAALDFYPFPVTVTLMEQLTSGFTVLLNGGLTSIAALANWSVVFGLLTAGSLVWLSRLEVDDVDRRATKPTVARH